MIIAFNCIFGALSEKLKCKTCDGNVRFEKAGCRGLGFQLCVKCKCPNDQKIDSCPTELTANKNNKIFEVNRKFVLVMRLLGVGISGINLFCSLMDICNGYSSSMYYGIMDNVPGQKNQDQEAQKEHELAEGLLYHPGIAD